MTPAASLSLSCHPALPDPAIAAVTVVVARAGDGGLTLRYRIDAPASDAGAVALVVPEPLPADAPNAASTDGLWQTTCCEIFLARRGDPAYREFNFSPSGAWAAYAFHAPRQREASPVGEDGWPAPPAISVERGADVFVLDAVLRPADLPPGTAPLDVGLSVVLETRRTDGRRHCSYWALRHPSAQPDFHDRAAFALTLAHESS